MAQIDAWLWDRLNTYSDLLAAIGPKKVFPVVATQTTQEPYVVFIRVGTQRQYTTRKQDGLPLATFHVVCRDKRYLALKTWAEHVRKALDGYQGDPIGFVVRSCFIEDEVDEPEPLDDGEGEPIYGVRFVINVRHTEEVVTYT